MAAEKRATAAELTEIYRVPFDPHVLQSFWALPPVPPGNDIASLVP